MERVFLETTAERFAIAKRDNVPCYRRRARGGGFRYFICAYED